MLGSDKQFLRERFPNTKIVVSECNKKLKGASTIRPEISEGQSVPWSTIGTAIDLRIRYYFSGAKLPPMISLGLSTPGVVPNLALPDSNEPFRMVKRDVVIDGRLIKNKRLLVPQSATDEEVDSKLKEEAVLKRNALRFIDDFDTGVQRLKLAGRRLSHDDEDLLARYFYVLSLFDLHGEFSPGGGLATVRHLFMYPEFTKTTAGLLRSVEDAWADDIRSLSWAFYDRMFTDGWLSCPAVPNPTFDNGTSGDLIVDGCLVEIKTTVKPKLQRDWLYQLLQYALLDREDRYGIREVGVYFARQREFVRWPIVDLMSALAEGDVPSLQAMRDACAAILSKKNPMV